MDIGRVDCHFSKKDKALWDVFEKIDKGDRGYWLKYYAALGVAASRNNRNQTLIINPLELVSSDTGVEKGKGRVATKRTRKNVENRTGTDLKVSQLSEKSVESNGSISATDSIPEQPQIDPMVKRKAAMGHMLTADDDLLKVFQGKSPDSEDSTKK